MKYFLSILPLFVFFSSENLLSMNHNTVDAVFSPGRAVLLSHMNPSPGDYMPTKISGNTKLVYVSRTMFVVFAVGGVVALDSLPLFAALETAAVLVGVGGEVYNCYEKRSKKSKEREGYVTVQ